MFGIKEIDSKILLHLDIKTLKIAYLLDKNIHNILNYKQFWDRKFNYDQLPILKKSSFQEYIKISDYRIQAEKILVINDIKCNKKPPDSAGIFTFRFDSHDLNKLNKLNKLLPEIYAGIQSEIILYNIKNPLIYITIKPVIGGINDLSILVSNGGRSFSSRYSSKQFINFITRCLYYDIGRGQFGDILQSSLSYSLDYLGVDVIKNHLDKIRSYLDNIK